MIGTGERVAAIEDGLTVKELSEQLLFLGADEGLVVDAMANAVTLRAETHAARTGFQRSVTDFAMAYKSLGQKMPGDEQMARFCERAQGVLVAATEGYGLLPRARKFGVPDPFEPKPGYTNPAAIVYTHGLLNSGQIRTPEDEDALSKFLEGAGVTPSVVHGYLRGIFTAHDKDTAWDEEERRYDTRLNTLARLGQLWGTTSPQRWSDIIGRSVKPMYEELHR